MSEGIEARFEALARHGVDVQGREAAAKILAERGDTPQALVNLSMCGRALGVTFQRTDGHDAGSFDRLLASWGFSASEALAFSANIFPIEHGSAV